MATQWQGPRLPRGGAIIYSPDGEKAQNIIYSIVKAQNIIHSIVKNMSKNGDRTYLVFSREHPVCPFTRYMSRRGEKAPDVPRGASLTKGRAAW